MGTKLDELDPIILIDYVPEYISYFIESVIWNTLGYGLCKKNITGNSAPFWYQRVVWLMDIFSISHMNAWTCPLSEKYQFKCHEVSFGFWFLIFWPTLQICQQFNTPWGFLGEYKKKPHSVQLCWQIWRVGQNIKHQK